MNEVIDQNFKKLYPKLEKAIEKASFIAIDAEFSGIQSKEVLKNSLFDSLPARYEKLRKNIEPFILFQCGVVTFQHVPDKNAYNAHCFNFYLLPRSVPFKNRQFSWQVAALEFLSTCKFDFNKFVHTGISYLDEVDEQLLRQQIDEGSLTCNLENLTFNEEDDFKVCKNKVWNWLEKSPTDLSFELKTASPILQYMVHKEIRNSFKNVWTASGNRSVIVIKVSPDMRKLLENEEANRLEEELLETYLGFSKIFKLLTSAKKPIVGHNLLLDLMFMHQQFYKPLPSKYSEFKDNVHKLFPQIYDTKLLSLELKKMLDKAVSWRTSSLKCMYEYFHQNKGKHLAFMSPRIFLKNESETEEKIYHNAGWDAYFTGYIFIKMAHLFSVKKYGDGLEQRPVTHSELMSSVKGFVNSVNIVRNNDLYLKLGADDPPSTKPEWLHVKLKSTVNIKELADKLCYFGQVDVMPFAQKRVLVAVTNHRSALDILQHFKNSEDMQVARYSPIRHAPPSRIILWSGVVLSSGIFAWMIHRIFKKSTSLQ